MSPLIVFTALIATALAAPQAIKPVVGQPIQPYQPFAYASPTPYHAQYTHGYSAPAYRPFAPAPVAPFKSFAAPVAPAIQPYHAYHQYAGQPQYNKPIAIVRFNHDDNFDGSFTYDFEGENGIANQASGYVKALGPNEQAQVMQGQYSYTAPDGTPIVTRWFADETGFHAEGAHLPENTIPHKTA